MRDSGSRGRSTVDASAVAGSRVARGALLARVLVLLLVVYIAWVVIPTVWASFQFRQAMQDEVLYGPPAEQPSLILSRLLAEARNQGLDIGRNAIRVDKQGARLRITAQYTVPMDFGAGLVWQWHQEPSYEGTRRAPIRR